MCPCARGCITVLPSWAVRTGEQAMLLGSQTRKHRPTCCSPAARSEEAPYRTPCGSLGVLEAEYRTCDVPPNTSRAPCSFVPAIRQHTPLVVGTNVEVNHLPLDTVMQYTHERRRDTCVEERGRESFVSPKDEPKVRRARAQRKHNPCAIGVWRTSVRTKSVA